MCETCDMGIKWPHWHTLIFEGEARVDMRYTCPKNVKKISLQQAMTVCWKKWAAQHEYEDLKEGIWLEPALAVLRKKTNEDWTEKHRIFARKLFLEGGWVQKRLFDIGWSDESECQALSQGGRYREAQALPLPRMVRNQKGDPRGFQKVGAKSQNFKERAEVANRCAPSQ